MTMARFKMKAGTWMTEKGYPRISGGPMRGKYVHIMVAEGMLGRELRKDEVVHHINGDTSNPRWTNLLVIGKETHDAVSRRQYWYLKQKFAREDAAWRAYFDVTGETPKEAWDAQSLKATGIEQSMPSGETEETTLHNVPEEIAADIALQNLPSETYTSAEG